MRLLVSVHLYSQQPFVCLQADDTENAPLLADAAAVVLSSPPSQVIIKNEVYTTKFPDSCDHHIKLYSPTLVQDAFVCCPCSSKGKHQHRMPCRSLCYNKALT
jgi:hypothetical protein